MHCFSLVEMFPLNYIFFSMESMAMLKSVADSGSPYLTPVWTSNFSANLLFIFTITFVPLNVSTILMVYYIDLSYLLLYVNCSICEILCAADTAPKAMIFPMCVLFIPPSTYNLPAVLVFIGPVPHQQPPNAVYFDEASQ